MGDTTAELTERFERYCDTKDHELPSDVLTELQLMLGLFAISPEDLCYKWQAYAYKMGGEDTRLDLKIAQDFKKNMQDALQREHRAKAQQKSEAKRVAPTPRAKGGDAYDLYIYLKKPSFSE